MHESGCERGYAQLVDADRASQRVFGYQGDQLRVARDDSGLRPAEQLVARKERQWHAGCHALLRHRLVGQPEPGRVQQTAAAQVVQHRDAALASQGHELRQLGRRGEARDLEVAGVGRQDGAGAVGDGGFEVSHVGPVRRADLHELRAALPQHVRDAKAAADLDSLAPGYDDLFARGDRREPE